MSLYVPKVFFAWLWPSRKKTLCSYPIRINLILTILIWLVNPFCVLERKRELDCMWIRLCDHKNKLALIIKITEYIIAGAAQGVMFSCENIMQFFSFLLIVFQPQISAYKSKLLSVIRCFKRATWILINFYYSSKCIFQILQFRTEVNENTFLNSYSRLIHRTVCSLV